IPVLGPSDPPVPAVPPSAPLSDRPCEPAQWDSPTRMYRNKTSQCFEIPVGRGQRAEPLPPRRLPCRSGRAVQRRAKSIKIARSEDDPVTGGHVDKVEVDTRLSNPAGEIGEHPR